MNIVINFLKLFQIFVYKILYVSFTHLTIADDLILLKVPK